MFGCHNCGKKIVKDTSYAKSPCAACRAQQNPMPHSRYREDPAQFSTLQVMHPAYDEPDEKSIELRIREELFHSLAKTIHILFQMKEQYPETYKFIEAKMGNPSLTYSELADMFSCKKQNVLYHLKKATAICPELRNALLIDTRFSGGHYALRNTAKHH